MAFPSNPTDGQTANVNGVVYTYSSSLTAWQVTTTFSGNVTVDQINANSVVSVNAITGETLSVAGNVTGGNLSVTGNVSISGSATGNLTVTGNIISPFFISSNTISANTTLGVVNTMTPGPITIANGVTVTVSSGGEWSIV